MRGEGSEAPAPISEKGARIALIYELAAERLPLFYEHDQWLTEVQGASLVAD